MYTLSDPVVPGLGGGPHKSSGISGSNSDDAHELNARMFECANVGNMVFLTLSSCSVRSEAFGILLDSPGPEEG